MNNLNELEEQMKYIKKQIKELEIEDFICKKNILEMCLKKYCLKTNSKYIIEEYDESRRELKIILRNKPIYKQEETGLDVYFKIQNNYLIISAGICQPYKYWEKRFGIMKRVDIKMLNDDFRNKIDKYLGKVRSHMLNRTQRKEYQECCWKVD